MSEGACDRCGDLTGTDAELCDECAQADLEYKEDLMEGMRQPWDL